MADVPPNAQFKMNELIPSFREELQGRFDVEMARIRTAIRVAEAQMEFEIAMKRLENPPVDQV